MLSCRVFYRTIDGKHDFPVTPIIGKYSGNFLEGNPFLLTKSLNTRKIESITRWRKLKKNHLQKEVTQLAYFVL